MTITLKFEYTGGKQNRETREIDYGEAAYMMGKARLRDLIGGAVVWDSETVSGINSKFDYIRCWRENVK